MLTKAPKARRIALAFPSAMVTSESLMHGILDYARSRGGWAFTRVPEQLAPSAAWLREWRGDGAFVIVTTPAEARLLRGLRFPVVNLMGYVPRLTLPTATLDHYSIGRLQAAHLLERHFKRLAYYGVSDLWFGRERLRGFGDAAKEAGASVVPWLVVSGIQARRRLTDQQAELTRWLRTLSPPFGVAASNDLRACMVLDACAAVGLRVPDEAAVIGVDNDPTVAPFSDPPLTSVARSDRELGYRGARLLDDLIEGRPTDSRHVQIAPSGVVCRRSTETLAVESPVVHALLQQVRANLGRPFGVEFLVANAQISRRQLERLFLQETGVAPYALLNRMRVEHACTLLAQPEKRSLTAIAAACGFTELRRFSLVFKQQKGVSPRAFRQQAQSAGGPA